MDKIEAIELMKLGTRMTHENFSSDEWVKAIADGSIYIFEDGVKLPAAEFWRYRTHANWNGGWSIYNELKAQAATDNG